jgi:hypothetical protein
MYELQQQAPNGIFKGMQIVRDRDERENLTQQKSLKRKAKAEGNLGRAIA